MPHIKVAADNKNDVFDLSPLTQNLPHQGLHQGNNHEVSLAEINRAFNTVVNVQSEI